MDLLTPLVLFFISSLIIVLAAVALVKGADTIASASNLGRLWVGSLLLAGATSLPEMITNISAVRINAPGMAAGNVFGANMLNMAVLATFAGFIGSKDVYQRFSSQQIFVGIFAIFMTTLALALTFTQIPGKLLVVTPASLILIGSFLGGARLLSRFTKTGVEEESEPPAHSLRWGWVVFAVAALAILGAGPLLASSAQEIAEISGISESFIGVLAVAIVTTLPEMTAAATAIRLGAHDLAAAGMYGSNAFNIAILGIADLFSPGNSLFLSLDSSHLIAALCACVLMVIGIAQIHFAKPVRRPAILDLGVLSVIVVYLIGLFLVFQLA